MGHARGSFSRITPITLHILLLAQPQHPREQPWSRELTWGKKVQEGPQKGRPLSLFENLVLKAWVELWVPWYTHKTPLVIEGRLQVLGKEVGGLGTGGTAALKQSNLQAMTIWEIIVPQTSGSS